MTAQIRMSLPAVAVPAAGLAVMAMVSMQLATALSRPLTQEIGAPALTWLRMAAASLVLLVLVRPRLKGLTRQSLGAAVLLGGTLGLMSFATFAAVARLPIGLVASIAFLGPLAISVIGAREARAHAAGHALLAGLGLGLMLWTGPGDGAPGTGWTLDPLGLGFALLAALGWALYILMTRRVGQLFKGTEGLCVSLITASVLLCPFGLQGLAKLEAAVDWRVVLGAAALGLLAPCLTCWLEMKALRRLGMQSFGIMMSLEPAVATVLGLIVLQEMPSLAQFAGMVCVTIASGASVLLPAREPAPAPAVA